MHICVCVHVCVYICVCVSINAQPDLTVMLKVVLLCGPPGLGKTTLAHIVAKHAGYNVVEMNAR